MTNFHHSGGNISFQGSSSDSIGGAVLESSSGVAGDAGDSIPLDTLLGSGKRLVEFGDLWFRHVLS